MPDKTERHSALGIYHFAEDFFRSAVHTTEAEETGRFRLKFSGFVAYHLHIHAAELTLKAFLRAHAVSSKELQYRYGHNLVALLQGCLRRGMVLEEHRPHTEAILGWLNEHGRAETFRYFESGYYSVPSLAEVMIVVERLLAAARPACVAQTRGAQ